MFDLRLRGRIDYTYPISLCRYLFIFILNRYASDNGHNYIVVLVGLTSCGVIDRTISSRYSTDATCFFGPPVKACITTNTLHYTVNSNRHQSFRFTLYFQDMLCVHYVSTTMSTPFRTTLQRYRMSNFFGSFCLLSCFLYLLRIYLPPAD